MAFGHIHVGFVPDINVGNKEKPLAEWTLAELKAFCEDRRCCNCQFFIEGEEGKECRFKTDNDAPCSWDLDEKPRFTEEEVEDVKDIFRLFGRGAWEKVSRDKDGMIVLVGYDLGPGIGRPIMDLQVLTFPSILPGQSVKLSEILGEVD